ncbi:MAG: stage 0 sporulation protein, partial [Lentisphaeria bacterium]|nr:stage 0 sporulation protein [Lentisphaeria bacterium]
MEDQIKHTPETAEVVDIQFRPGQKIYYFDPAGIACKAGDHVIIDTARGPEFGICTSGNHRIPKSEVVAPLRAVLRRANEQDERIAKENQEKEKRAFALCLDKIREQELDMQLVSAECAFDGSKILFF